MANYSVVVVAVFVPREMLLLTVEDDDSFASVPYLFDSPRQYEVWHPWPHDEWIDGRVVLLIRLFEW
jgi:hypothetical protein